MTRTDGNAAAPGRTGPMRRMPGRYGTFAGQPRNPCAVLGHRAFLGDLAVLRHHARKQPRAVLRHRALLSDLAVLRRRAP